MQEKGNNKYLPLVLADTGVSHNYDKKVVGLEQFLTKKEAPVERPRLSQVLLF